LELDYHTLLEDQRAVLIASMEEIMETRDSLPGCQLRWGIYEELFVTQEGPLCQCPLTPEEFREAVLEDPDTAACDQLYPCYWTDQDTYACDLIAGSSCGLRNICEVEGEEECLEGPHFPNPVCKVYAEDRAELTAQINEARLFVMDLEEYVKDTYFSGGNPCPTPLGEEQGPYPPEQGDEPTDLSSPPAGCDPGFDFGNFCPPTEVPELPVPPPVLPPEIPEDCESGTVQFDVVIHRVGLYGDRHEPCSREDLGTGQAVVLFEFDYYIVCSCCELDLVVIPPPPPANPTDPPGEPTYEYECTCTNTIYEGFGLWGWACIDAPDIDLNLVGLCSGEGGLLEFGEFLGTLGLFDEHLASLTREASACDPDISAFATIDADAEDEFAPVTASMCEMEEQLAIFNEEIQAWGGQLLDPWAAVPPGGSYWGTGVTDAPVTVENEENGAGSLSYAWEDSRGEHEVTVTTGPFVFAWVRKEKSGNFLINKTCMVLTDYCDNLSGCGDYEKMSPGDVYVEIERLDEVGQREVTSTGEVDLGLRWYTAAPTGRIRRLSRAGYSYDFVGVGGIR
ncbi:MAG: hypothetical protein MJA29_12960, partial [Candidatus Omnitrophica bacterium]|nr:hypothetical protein [Candidatus Omnitrophota bacterium]